MSDYADLCTETADALDETHDYIEALIAERDAARRQNDELAAQLAEAREGYMMLPEDLEVQRLRAEVKRQTVNVTALCDDNERLAGERDQARADAVAFADECAGIEDQDSPCGVPIYDRIAEYREAMKRETPPSR